MPVPLPDMIDISPLRAHQATPRFPARGNAGPSSRPPDERTSAIPVSGHPNLAVFAANRAKIIGYLRALGASDGAEDLAHEIWLKLAKSSEADLLTTAYLMRMAHNLFIDQVRSDRQRHRREEAYQYDGPGGGEIDRSPDSERVLLSRERLARLEAALRTLGPRTEQIVRRHRVEGVPHRLLAEEFGISVSAIEKQLQKAYRVIAMIQLEQDEEEKVDPDASR